MILHPPYHGRIYRYPERAEQFSLLNGYCSVSEVDCAFSQLHLHSPPSAQKSATRIVLEIHSSLEKHKTLVESQGITGSLWTSLPLRNDCAF